ncbi:MAG TPA: hypothetical protein VF278_08715 [Pirellulales bacterium]
MPGVFVEKRPPFRVEKCAQPFASPALSRASSRASNRHRHARRFDARAIHANGPASHSGLPVFQNGLKFVGLIYTKRRQRWEPLPGPSLLGTQLRWPSAPVVFLPSVETPIALSLRGAVAVGDRRLRCAAIILQEHCGQFGTIGSREICKGGGQQHGERIGALIGSRLGLHSGIVGGLVAGPFVGRFVLVFRVAGATSGATARTARRKSFVFNTCFGGLSRSQCEGRGFDSLPLHLKTPADISCQRVFL